MRFLQMRGLAAAVSCAAALVAGCTAVEVGSPIAGGSTPVLPATTTMFPSSDPSDAPGGDGVASVDPCALLTEEELSQYGEFKEPSPDQLPSGARACDLDRVPSIDNRGPILGFVVRGDRGVDDFRDLGSGVDRGQLDSGREFAREGAENNKDCTMALAVGEQARVDIEVFGARSNACDVAAELAEIVDPRLPQG